MHQVLRRFVYSDTNTTVGSNSPIESAITCKPHLMPKTLEPDTCPADFRASVERCCGTAVDDIVRVNVRAARHWACAEGGRAYAMYSLVLLPPPTATMMYCRPSTM